MHNWSRVNYVSGMHNWSGNGLQNGRCMYNRCCVDDWNNWHLPDKIHMALVSYGRRGTCIDVGSFANQSWLDDGVCLSEQTRLGSGNSEEGEECDLYFYIKNILIIKIRNHEIYEEQFTYVFEHFEIRLVAWLSVKWELMILSDLRGLFIQNHLSLKTKRDISQIVYHSLFVVGKERREVRL